MLSLRIFKMGYVGPCLIYDEGSSMPLLKGQTLSIDERGIITCLLYTSPSPRDRQKSRMPSSA